MANTLQELVEDRRQMLEVLERNGSAQGIQRLLTDLYPDSAHFVYELLQNAEDAGATKAEFVLREDGVCFSHNGAREFTLDDVDAITAIGGNVGKREDSTSIGEFGVGFKAVFSYTLSPEIHSGAFHFRIKNHFLVETDGVPQRFLHHEASQHWTEFDLPFNNPEKPQSKAYAETLRGLERLDETSLLFLRNIASIKYTVEGSRPVQGYARRFEEGENEVALVVKAPTGQERISSFLRYVRDEVIVSDRGKRKTLPIAVAYALGKDKDGKDGVVPTNGKTFIYFPAEKEYSKLRFHINAPFSATVARDSIRDCPDNDKLMRSVAALVADSLADIKKRGLLTASFYNVMPNQCDELAPAYLSILEAVKAAFAANEYLVAKREGYVRSADALRGPAEFSDLLNGPLLKAFSGMEGKWILNLARNLNKRGCDFLDTLGIREFDAFSFAEAFAKRSRRDALLEEAKSRDIVWMKLLYRAMSEACRVKKSDDMFGSEYARRLKIVDDYITALRSSAFVLCNDGVLHSPNEAYFLPEGFDAESISDPIVDERLVAEGAGTRYYDVGVAREMLKTAGVAVYSIEVELKRLVGRYRKISSPLATAKDKAYYNDVLTLAKAHAKGIDVDVANVAMFLGRTPDGKDSFMKAGELALGSDYGVELGDELAKFQWLPVVNPVYARIFKDGDLDVFVSYMRWLGVQEGLVIVEANIAANPKWHVMRSRGGTLTKWGVQRDWTIRGLPDSLENVTPAVAFEIWKLLCKNGSTSNYAEAFYRSKARAEPQTADSQLVSHLKKAAWLPDVLGKMHKPGAIRIQDLDPAFADIAEGKLVAALEIGSEISAQKLAENKLKSEAERLGQHVISEEDYKFLQAAKEKERKSIERQAEKDRDKLSAQGLLDKQGREQRPDKTAGLREDSGAVNNPDRRAQKIDETIKDLEKMPIKKRGRFSVVTLADKREKETLREWYRGRCQICDAVILRHDGEPYFEAINIISSSDLPERHKNSAEIGWNSLCLCPNCAAKYRFSGKKLSGFAEQVAHTAVQARDDERIPISIELAGREVEIRFTPKHFLALQVGLRRLDEE